MVLPLLGFAAALALGGFLLWERHDMAAARVYGELRGRKATDIKITPDWLDFDRDTMTYDVTYTAADGVRKANTCKVSVGPHSDHRVYWASPV
ncbi:MAG: hypothetical protein H0V56_10175 [Chthoniobacterales bacterium]|nr:hypothetical protein [Chthoniobacterales bacterium]